ncbi:MAG: ATP-binding cassette domain-containing protein [Nostoc indistinguendum CM1-VF10]|jgi:ABC-type multidrug transport system ATPase subunit|nr:ATP-binding cassette domain-containing protein [Nostoc indistinguendum CM1-VF10]
MKSVADDPDSQLNTADTAPVVLTSELRKVYRTGFWLNQKVVSLKNCSLTVYKGETFGLLGPNGAGKTTLLKLLLGIIRPSSGRGLLLGKPIGDRIAILAQGELICSGSLSELLGKNNTYHVKGQGGDCEILQKWIPTLKFEPDGSWQGTLQDDYYDFLSSLRLMEGKIIAMNLSRYSLEEFFIQQIQIKNNSLN